MLFTTSEICTEQKTQWCEKPSENPKKKAQEIAAKRWGWGWGGVSASVGHPPPHHLDVVSWWDEVKILLGRLLPLRFNLDLPVLPGSPTRDRLEKNDRTTSDFTTKIRSFFSGKKVGGLKFEMQPNYWGMKWLLFFLLLLLLLRNSVVLFDRKKNPSLEGWHVLQITQVFLCYESTSAVCFSIPKGGQLDHWHWLAICGSWGWGARVTPSRNDVVQTSAMTDHTNDKLVYQVFLFKAKQWKLVVVNAMSSFWVLKQMQCDCCCFLHGDVRFIGSGRLFCDLAWCAVEPQAVGHVRT